MKVDLFNVGWVTAAAGIFRRDDPLDRQSRFPVPAYVIETATERILVDTGLNPGAAADAPGHYGTPDALALFGLEVEESIADQIDLSTITKVVLTHLHFDHAGGLALLPGDVPVVVQRREWEAGEDAAAIEKNFFMPADYAVAAEQVTLVDGDHDLLGDGSVQLLFTPGHTPGHQSIYVGGEFVIGADVTHLASGFDDHRFPVFGDDHAAQAKSAERLKALRDAGAVVLPGHDPEVIRPGQVWP